MDALESLGERRLKDASSARDMWVRFRKASSTRRGKLTKVMNQLDGVPPFLASDLIASGQGWRCNINFRDAASTLDQVLVSYWRLLHDAPNLAAVTMPSDDQHARRNSNAFQDAFNRFVEDWGPDYVHQYLQFAFNMIAIGVGIPYFPTPQSPKWETVRTGDFECPPRTKTTIKSLNVFQVRGSMEIEDLWKKVRTPEQTKSSKSLGWNPGAINDLLAHVIKDDGTTVSEDDVLEIQRMMRADALGTSAGRKPVRVIHTYVLDYDNKITHTISAEDSEDKRPLFDDHGMANRPDEMSEVVGPVFFDAGNGDFWGVKGFGVKNHEIAATTNRLKSRAVDRTFIDGLNFIDKRDNAGEVPNVVSVGPVNLLPPGLEQLSTYPGGRAILETVNMLDAQFSTNNARYRDNAKQVSGANTATEANILANLQSQVDVSNATLFLHQVARNIFTEQFRRLRARGNNDPCAKMFKKRCVEEHGMDEKTFHDFEITVRTSADPGAANLAVRGQKALELAAFPHADERYWQELWVAANLGSNAVKSALRPIDQLEDRRAQGLAVIENSVLSGGDPIPVDRSHNHAEHLPIHMQPAQVLVDQFQQTGQPDPSAMVALQFLLPHIGEHLEELKKDKSQEALFRELWPMFTGIQSAAEGMFAQAERLQQQQDQQGQQATLPGAIGATAPQ